MDTYDALDTLDTIDTETADEGIDQDEKAKSKSRTLFGRRKKPDSEGITTFFYIFI